MVASHHIGTLMTAFAVRVTHLASGDLWGGAEAFVYALASEQHRVRPGSVSCVIMNPGQLANELIRHGIPTLVLNETESGFFELRRAVESHIRSFRPHVLHAHRQKENLLAFLSGLGKRSNGRRLRYVTTVHGMPEPIHRQRVLRTGLKNAVNSAALHLGFDAVVGVSIDIASRLETVYPTKHVLCIHNGVVVPPQVVRSTKKREGSLRLLALGRLVPIKRFDRLKQLSDVISQSGLSRPIITLAGDGPLREDLQALFQEGVASSRVQMPGFVVDTASLMADTDALVITSDHEGIPMAVLEALARGVPVFGFAVGGLPEIATPGVPLYLVPPTDTPALAQAIVRHFTNEPMGSRVAPPQDWSFDIRSCARDYEALYSRL